MLAELSTITIATLMRGREMWSRHCLVAGLEPQDHIQVISLRVYLIFTGTDRGSPTALIKYELYHVYVMMHAAITGKVRITSLTSWRLTMLRLWFKVREIFAQQMNVYDVQSCRSFGKGSSHLLAHEHGMHFWVWLTKTSTFKRKLYMLDCLLQDFVVGAL